MSQVRLSSQAVRDLDEIEDYISHDNPDAAARLILSIREKCALLSGQPGIGRDRSELLPELRGFQSAIILFFIGLFILGSRLFVSCTAHAIYPNYLEWISGIFFP
jgi:plasmid stabilization system protein ParE